MSNHSYRRFDEESTSSSENEGQHSIASTGLSLENPTEAALRGQLGFKDAAGGDITLYSPVITKDVHVSPSISSATTAVGKESAAEDDDDDDDDDITEVDLNKEEGEEKVKASLFKRLTGILAILFATALVALNNEILYYTYMVLKTPYSKSLFLTWSYIIYCVENYIPLQFAMCKNMKAVSKPLKDDRRLIILLVVRGVLGSSIQFVTSHAIDRFAKPAPVSVITAMAPIFVYINAYFVLKEKLGVIPIINVFVAIGGVVVMNAKELQHPANSKTLEGTGLALTSMYLLSWVTVVIRFLRDVHPLLINMAFGVGGIFVQGTIVLFENSHYWLADRLVLMLCIGSATITAVGNFFYNVALQYESAGVVSLIRTTEVVFSFLFQFCLFGIQPDLLTAAGGGMILFGVLCVTLRKIVSESSEHSSLRRYLWFLLY